MNRYYKRLTGEINSKVGYVNIDTVLEGRGTGVLKGSYTIPGSFTINGYREFIRRIPSAAEEMKKDDWVMGPQSQESKDVIADTTKLQAMYFREYTDQWRKFLRGINIQEFTKKDDAVEAFRTLTATSSPMVVLLTEVSRNTNISAGGGSSGIIGWFKGLFSSKSGDTGGNTEVEREFKPLFTFVAAEGDKETAPISQYRKVLTDVLDKLESTREDQLAQTSKALLTGKDDIGLQKADQNLSKLLDPFKTVAGKDVAGLLKKPLENLRALVYGSGYEQIEKTWREQVYPKAHALEAGFPFTDGGEASVTDLTSYLNPVNGQFTSFFNDKLASSFDDAQGQWKLKESGGFKFSDSFVNYLNGTRKLRDAVFPANGQQPEVSYEIMLQPVSGADVVIEIDGNRLESHGTSPQSSKFIWPARAGASGGRITVIKAGAQSADRTFPGEWGLFKMFEAGGATKTGDNQYILNWNVGAVSVRANLRPSSSTNPFQLNMFKQLKAPQSLRD